MTARSVCVITEAPSFGGSVVHTLGLIAALVARGRRVDVIANGFDPYTAWAREQRLEDRVSVRHTRLAGITPEVPTDVAGWRAVLEALDSDLLIFPKGHYFHGQLEFLRLCRARFERIVFIEHLEAPPAPQRPRPWLGVIPRPGLAWQRRRRRQQRASGFADVTVAVSAAVRDRLVGDYGLAASSVVVVRNGVRWREFARDAAAASRFRDRHAIPPGTFVFGMMTRLAPVKGVDVALAAVRLVAATGGRAFTLVVAGEGPDRDALVAQASALGVDARVRFVGAIARPIEALSAFDVILFSSRAEGLPLALLEGLAAGCIPIVTDIGGMREAVAPPAGGWVVPAEDAESLAAAMRAALALDDDASRAMRGRGVERIATEFDADACYGRILDLCGIPAVAGAGG